ncbi:MAG TPA: class I SAM-dependent methyltransferase [Anaerolineae bacterium]|nr:class I SAM-dependent methyltransferase [Anaerolineae bacterium]
MNCCQCQGLESLFDQKTATKELESYRQKGSAKTTQMLIQALKAKAVANLTLLDVGGGVGAIQHALFKAGIRQATHVDASSAYLRASQEEAQRQGHSDRITYRFGNLIELAPELGPVDIVTLDRVVCCYHDVEALIEASAKLAGQRIGLVYPRETWWLEIGRLLINTTVWVQRNPFRFFVHPTSTIEAILRQYGFERRFYQKTFLWQVAVYAK